MKKLKITLGILFVFQMFAFGAFAANTTEKVAENKLAIKAADCCLFWGGTTTFAVQVCGYGDQNCVIAKMIHGILYKRMTKKK
ncbi:hypothetical protein V7S76_03440 [Aquirufa sp. ROCK2-A2]